MTRPFSSPSGTGGSLRRKPFGARLLKMLRYTAWVGCALALGTGGFYGYRYVNHFIYASGYFQISQVQISGASETLSAEVQTLLNRQLSRFGNNLCRVNQSVLLRILYSIPRVKAVSVAKIYPQTLQVQFKEREPLMVANLERPYLIDREGVLIGEVAPGAIRKLGLPVLTGIRGTLYRAGDRVRQANLPELLQAVSFIREKDPVLRGRFVEWNLNGREEVTAIMDSPAHTEVRFGDQAPLERLDKLSAVLAVRKDLLENQYIDLRMDGQLVYKLPDRL